ncbi:uncharacterized protein TNCV_1932991 [Trichonephila clavipes]|nr:uncharacterized protein TNCV_1932991 [Trichonephila clavipes]
MGTPTSRNVEPAGSEYAETVRRNHCMTQGQIQGQILQGQIQARHPVACILLTPSRCLFRYQWYHARDYWSMEWRSVVFSDESRFCLRASDGSVLVRRSGEGLQVNCLCPRHTKPAPGVMVWRAISYIIAEALS